ncbi:MAG: twin-arginine translocase subunit TatC [Chlamydiales bacterium]|nr:twin-arginine translocase subunit TatC [Chlamydiales bacterium]
MTFWEHVEELRKTLLRMMLVVALATVAAFCFHKPLFNILLAPLEIEKLYLFSPLEGFTTVLKTAFWAGLLASSPLWTFFLLQFILPALRGREKRLILPFFFLSALFIVCGILLAYTVTLPLVTQFFRSFNEGIGENLWGLGETLNFALMLVLAHGLVFELYVGLLFLIHFSLLSADRLRQARRGVIVLILVLAALLTPPDLLSQILLALPMLLLYETAVFYSLFLKKRLKKSF